MSDILEMLKKKLGLQTAQASSLPSSYLPNEEASDNFVGPPKHQLGPFPGSTPNDAILDTVMSAESETGFPDATGKIDSFQNIATGNHPSLMKPQEGLDYADFIRAGHGQSSQFQPQDEIDPALELLKRRTVLYGI